MLTINGNNMTLTSGDTLTLTISIFRKVAPVPPATEPTTEPYIPTEDDVIRFAVSKSYKGDAGYSLKFSKVIPNDTLTFTCTSEETSLPIGSYNYDIEITFADGCVDTFLSGKLNIIGEVK